MSHSFKHFTLHPVTDIKSVPNFLAAFDNKSSPVSAYTVQSPSNHVQFITDLLGIQVERNHTMIAAGDRGLQVHDWVEPWTNMMRKPACKTLHTGWQGSAKCGARRPSSFEIVMGNLGKGKLLPT